MTAERSEAARVLQLPLTVVVGGEARGVRPRTMAESDAWVGNSLVPAIMRAWGKVGRIESWQDALAQIEGSGFSMIAVIFEYDTEGALGGPGPGEGDEAITGSWLYQNATPAEIWEAVKVLAQSAFPFAPDATRFVPTLVSMVLARIASASKAASGQARSMPQPSGPGADSQSISTTP